MTRTNKTLVDCLIAIAAVMLVVCIVRAEPPTFTVTNRMSEFKVVNKCPATKTVKAFATRPARGHTHTCSHGHTWDHDANPTHTCQFCGMTQYVVDTPSRPVTIVVNKTVQAAPVAYVLPPVLQTLHSSVSAGGCANGACSTVTTNRGLLRWR